MNIMKTGTEFITEERQRQIDVEDFTTEDDANLIHCELPLASICYLGYCLTIDGELVDRNGIPETWPFEDKWWKPTPDDRIRELAKAGALIAAEIDRLQNIK